MFLSMLLAALLPFCAVAAPLATAEVVVDDGAGQLVADGAVEAVRQSEIAAQVQGRVTALQVHAGDRVKAGQVLLRIDERIARQQALAGRSQTAALVAQLDAATKEYQRQQRLFKQGFLSQAALERAESQFKTVQAQTRAQMAEVESAVVQTGLHALVAPYAGVASRVSAELGDMASPGKPLVMLYDPTELRVSVNVPQARLASLRQSTVTVDIPAAPTKTFAVRPDAVTILPTADPVSQMVQVRIALPTTVGLVPGMFARARLPIDAGSGQARRISVPSQAVFRRSELAAVYVIDAGGKPQLRLVRTGRVDARMTEILAGLEPGEKVVLDPLAVAAQR